MTMIFLKKIRNQVRRLLRKPDRYTQLFEEIRRIKPLHIMEVGTWNGNRAAEMIRLAQKFHPKEEIHYYGFDLFEQMTSETFEAEISKWPPSKAEVENKLKELGSHVHLYQGNTMETLPSTVGTLPVMDFIFIDGGHHKDTVANDWLYAEKVMGPKTVTIFDDYWIGRSDFGGAAPIIDQIDTQKYDVSIMPIEDSIKNETFGDLKIRFAKVIKKFS